MCDNYYGMGKRSNPTQPGYVVPEWQALFSVAFSEGPAQTELSGKLL